MFSRRAFLTRILGGVAATLVVASLPKAVQAIVDEPLRLDDPEMLPTYQGALDYVWQCFLLQERDRLGWPRRY